MKRIISQSFDMFHDFTICRILFTQRMRQRYLHGVNPEIHKPHIRDDLRLYASSLRKEFDYANHFRERRRYFSILFMRRIREAPHLAEWMNKIWLHDHLKIAGVPTLGKYYVSYECPPPLDLLSGLSRYVAKPAHLSEGDAVFVVSNGRELKSGRDVYPERIARRLAQAMSDKTVSWDTWATRNSKGGVIVEEMASDINGLFGSIPDEVKLYCIWGKVYFGVWRKRNVYQHGGFLYRDRYIDHLRPVDRIWWKMMIDYAEIVAAGTDLLRVDMFINGGNPVVSEVEIMPATPIPFALQTEIANLLNVGYALRQPA